LRRRRRLTLAGGTGFGVGIIILISILGLPPHYENLRSASIISASWGQDPGVAEAMPRQEILPLKTQGEPEQPAQPAYAYLHPETPSPQLQAEKNAPSSWPQKNPRLRKAPPRAKTQKTAAKTPKKEKPAAPGKKKEGPYLIRESRLIKASHQPLILVINRFPFSVFR
jgi:hypothetical protein